MGWSVVDCHANLHASCVTAHRSCLSKMLMSLSTAGIKHPAFNCDEICAWKPGARACRPQVIHGELYALLPCQAAPVTLGLPEWQRPSSHKSNARCVAVYKVRRQDAASKGQIDAAMLAQQSGPHSYSHMASLPLNAGSMLPSCMPSIRNRLH